jgi:uncharacterized membrane protein
LAKEDGMGFEQTMDAIARGVEIIGIVTLVLGLAAALVRAGLVVTSGQGGEEAYRIVRTVFGRSILLGLEFLVAADIIRTVAVQPSLENVAVLGLIVLIAGGGDRRALALAARRPQEGSAVAGAGVAWLERAR